MIIFVEVCTKFFRNITQIPQLTIVLFATLNIISHFFDTGLRSDMCIRVEYYVVHVFIKKKNKFNVVVTGFIIYYF